MVGFGIDGFAFAAEQTHVVLQDKNGNDDRGGGDNIALSLWPNAGDDVASPSSPTTDTTARSSSNSAWSPSSTDYPSVVVDIASIAASGDHSLGEEESDEDDSLYSA